MFDYFKQADRATYCFIAESYHALYKYKFTISKLPGNYKYTIYTNIICYPTNDNHYKIIACNKIQDFILSIKVCQQIQLDLYHDLFS